MCPAQPASKSGGKSPRGAESHQGVRKADQSTESRPTGRGQAHRAGPRGTPERHAAGHNQAHGQVPSKNGRRVLQTRKARTTRNERRHQNRCKATPAAVQMDVCAPGSDPTPCRLLNGRRQDGRVRTRQHTQPLSATKQPASGWTCACPEHSQPLPATKSRFPDGRVRAPQRSSAHPAELGCGSTWIAGSRRAKKAHLARTRVTRSQVAQHTQHATHSTTERASTPVNRSHVAEDTAHATQRAELAHR